MENQQQPQAAQLDVQILLRHYQDRVSQKENELVINQAMLEQKTREADTYKERLLKLEQQLEKTNKQEASPSEAE
jgi:predicted HAD superfamily hydrolase